MKSCCSRLIKKSSLIDRLLDSTGSILSNSVKREKYKKLFNNENHLIGALNFMAETDVQSVLQNVSLLTTKFFFIIGTRDSWVRLDSLQKILREYFPSAKVLELDGGHLLNETHSEELCNLVFKELPGHSDGI